MSRYAAHPGDEGMTVLIHGETVRKDDPRLEAVGTFDEMNSFIGLALSYGVPDIVEQYATRVQRLTFDIGTLTVCGCKEENQDVSSGITHELDEMAEALSALLPELHTFILPGGTSAAAAFHVARTVCRRAERTIIAVDAQHIIPREVCAAVNRMSTVLFLLARVCNCQTTGKESTVT